MYIIIQLFTSISIAKLRVKRVRWYLKYKQLTSHTCCIIYKPTIIALTLVLYHFFILKPKKIVSEVISLLGTLIFQTSALMIFSYQLKIETSTCGTWSTHALNKKFHSSRVSNRSISPIDSVNPRKGLLFSSSSKYSKVRADFSGTSHTILLLAKILSIKIVSFKVPNVHSWL